MVSSEIITGIRRMRKKVEDSHLLDEFLKSTKDKSPDFKALTLKLVNQLDSVQDASKLTGIPEQTIYDWLEEWLKKNKCLEQ